MFRAPLLRRTKGCVQLYRVLDLVHGAFALGRLLRVHPPHHQLAQAVAQRRPALVRLEGLQGSGDRVRRLEGDERPAHLALLPS